MFAFIVKIALFIHLLLVIGVTLRIVWRNDLSPVARLAWFIVVLVFPYLGVIAYWLFGEIDLGHKVSRPFAPCTKLIQRFWVILRT